jgi:hypothetical protein
VLTATPLFLHALQTKDLRAQVAYVLQRKELGASPELRVESRELMIMLTATPPPPYFDVCIANKGLSWGYPAYVLQIKELGVIWSSVLDFRKEYLQVVRRFDR